MHKLGVFSIVSNVTRI